MVATYDCSGEGENDDVHRRVLQRRYQVINVQEPQNV